MGASGGGGRFLVPTRNRELIRWSLGEAGFIQTMALLTNGPDSQLEAGWLQSLLSYVLY